MRTPLLTLLAALALSVSVACENTRYSSAEPRSAGGASPAGEPRPTDPARPGPVDASHTAAPVPEVYVQVGHSTPWTGPSGSTKVGAVAPPDDSSVNDAYIGLRLKRSDERTRPDARRGVQGGDVGGAAAAHGRDIVVRVRATPSPDGETARPGRDYALYAQSPARNPGQAPLEPVRGSDPLEWEIPIPARTPGTVVWIGFLGARSGRSPAEVVLDVVDAYEDVPEGRPVRVGWNDRARFVLEPYRPELRMKPDSDPGRLVVQFQDVASAPNRPAVPTEVVAEGDGSGLGRSGSNEHRWNLVLRRGDVEDPPGSGRIGGKPAKLGDEVTVVFGVDAGLSTATLGEDFVFIDGFGGEVVPPDAGAQSWSVTIPRGESSAPIYLRVLRDRTPRTEGWEQLVVDITRVAPASVGIGWNSKARWLVQDAR